MTSANDSERLFVSKNVLADQMAELKAAGFRFSTLVSQALWGEK
jgi:hypothetical protein